MTQIQTKKIDLRHCYASEECRDLMISDPNLGGRREECARGFCQVNQNSVKILSHLAQFMLKIGLGQLKDLKGVPTSHP